MNFETGETYNGLPEGFNLEEYCSRGTGTLQTVSEGTVFDLGGITLKIYETPGHTQPVMDGYTATAALRSLRRDDAKTAIILAMTANVFSDDVIKAEASGMNGHISKPFDPDKLYAMIAASCHKKRG